MTPVPAVVAHRGGALLWPENSRQAVEGACALGVDQVQVDVHLSADDEVVVLHDATLDRTTTGTGPVGLHRWHELRRLRLRGTADEPLLRLEDAASIVAGSTALLRLEIKVGPGGPYKGFAERIVAALERQGMTGRTVLSAFSVATMAGWAVLCPAVPRVLLVNGPTLAATPVPELAAHAAAQGCTTLGARWSGLDPGRAEAVRAAGLRLCCFGCNDDAAITAAFGLGADEIVTDRPDLALRMRSSRG